MWTLATAELPVPAIQPRQIQQLGRQIPEPDKNIHRASVDSGDAPVLDPGDATRSYPLDSGDTH